MHKQEIISCDVCSHSMPDGKLDESDLDRCPSGRLNCGTPETASRATTSTSADKVNRCRSQGKGHRKLTEVPKAEVAGLPNEKVAETLETRLPSSEPI